MTRRSEANEKQNQKTNEINLIAHAFDYIIIVIMYVGCDAFAAGISGVGRARNSPANQQHTPKCDQCVIPVS